MPIASIVTIADLFLAVISELLQTISDFVQMGHFRVPFMLRPLLVQFFVDFARGLASAPFPF